MPTLPSSSTTYTVWPSGPGAMPPSVPTCRPALAESGELITEIDDGAAVSGHDHEASAV